MEDVKPIERTLEIPNRLGEVLKDYGCSQTRMAGLLGYQTPAYIHHLIRGYRPLNLLVAVDIIRALRSEGHEKVMLWDLWEFPEDVNGTH